MTAGHGRPGEGVAGDATRVVRPYLMTRGRTRSTGADLPLEALVQTTNIGERSVDRLTFEHQRIVSLCERPTAIAEIAAHLSVPIGVARVLVSDLTAAGSLEVYDAPGRADAELVTRLIKGVREL